jgi:hypothetical protein
MNDRRELEGIGSHYLDDEADCLLVEQWTKRPDDLKGQTLTVGKLLPQEFRRIDMRNLYNTEYVGKSTPKKFRFRITIEVDRMV